MKTKSVHAMLLLCAATVFISCRKQTANVSVRKQLLTKESWTYDQFGIDQNLDGNIDLPESLDDCEKDDIITFNTNGSGSFDQGADLCYPTFPQTQSFDWSLQNEESQLEYGGAIHNIIELNETELSIYTEEDDGSGAVRHVLKYKR